MQLTIDRLTKQYKDKIAVDRISLELNKGVYGLLGANGAGKTTLMRMMSGVLKPTAGHISFNNFDVSQEEYRELLGYLPQDFGYYPQFTGYQFLMYMSSIKGIPKKMAKSKTNALLEQVALTEVRNKKVREYSGGMKQRLGIAQALLNNPKILILDEPTVGLDPKERVKFRNMISRLGEDRLVLLSTHIVSDIENIANTILIMKDGQIIQKGQQNEIIKVMDNKVFECKVDDNMAQTLIEEYQVVNIRQVEGEKLIRLIADNPIDGAVTVPPTLEDLYLYYFKEV